MLADEGLLGGQSLPGSLPLPPSLRSMIGARLDRLPDREKHLALRPPWSGAPSGLAWPGLVASLNGMVDDVEAALEPLAGLDARAEAEERPTSNVRGERESLSSTP